MREEEVDSPLYGTLDERLKLAELGWCFLFAKDNTDFDIPFDLGSLLAMEIAG